MICPLKYCKKRPKYSDGIIVHPYCGRTCANIAKGKGPANGNTPIPTSPVKATNPFIVTNPSSTTTLGNTTGRGVPIDVNFRNCIISTSSINMQKDRSSVWRKAFLTPTCKTPECSSPVYVCPNGVASDYCNGTHRRYVSQLYLVS